MIVEELFAKLGLKPDKESFERGDKLLEGIKHGLEIVAGAEAIHFIGELVDKTIEAAVGAQRLSQKLGLSTDAVQELGYAADASGASSEEMQVSLQHLAKGMEEIRTKGTGPAADGLKSLGVSMNEVRDKSPDEVLGVLADHFAKLPDGPRKTAAAMNLFGRSGTALIPLLNKGASGVKDLRQEAEELGVVIDKDGIEKSEEFEQTQKKLHATLVGLRNQAVVALLPAIQEMATSLFEWVKANREIITSAIKGVINGLAIAFGVLADVVAVAVQVFEFFADHADLAQAVLIALGVVIGAFAAHAAIAWVLAFWPLVAAVAAIAAIVLVVQDLWKGITKGTGVSARVFGALKRAAQSVWEYIRSIPGKIADAFASVGDSIRKAFGAVFDWIVAKYEWVKRKVHEFIDGNPDVMATQSGVLGDMYRAGLAQQQQQQVGGAPSTSVPGARNVTTGDTNIYIQGAAGSPDQTAAKVKQAMDDHTDSMLRAVP